jgi:hypothetical protein
MTHNALTSQLCSSCQKIDFAAFLPTALLEFRVGSDYFLVDNYIRRPDGVIEPKRNQNYIRRPDGVIERKGKHRTFLSDVDLGWLKDVVSRADTCSFCHFITRKSKKHNGEHFTTQIDGEDLACRVYKTKIGEIKNYTAGLPYRTVAETGWQISCISVDCFTKGFSFKGFSVPHSAFIAGKELRNIGPTYLGMARPTRCNFTLFKKWIACCKTGHQQNSESSAARPLLRLVDVQDKLIVTFNAIHEEKPSYVALSYVWGNRNRDYMLTKQNEEKYHTKNGLPPLPKTIADAMEAVAHLDQRYLWVDALCILQDDDQDKAVQIPAMKTVYGGALVTIVAAAGDSVDAGLPGVNTDRTEPLVSDVGEYRVTEAVTPLDPSSGSPIINTTWNTRAWTFQELLLSPRSLIFLDQQVYFHCPDAEYFEEVDFVDSKMQFFWGNDNIFDRVELTVQNFGNLIEQYTKRKLTFDGDIYHAFAGVLEAIPEKFFWGIPHSRFGEYLVWDEAWDMDRKKEEPMQLRNLPEFPTWSWMAWKGQLSMRYGGRLPLSLISCYRFRNGQLELMSTPSIVSFPLGNDAMSEDLPTETMWKSEDEYLVTIEDIPSTIVLKENHVIFWTFAFTIEVQNGLEDQGEAETGLVSHDLALIGTHGWGDLHVLELSWKSGIAKRVRLHRSDNMRRFRSGGAAKKLIILS